MPIPIPKDDDRSSVPLTPRAIALAQTVNGSISSSTSIAFNAATTFIRVYAISQDIYLKWGTTAVTSSNFDEVIPAGQIVDLYVPTTSAGVLYSACRVIERTASATIIVIEK